ncbi:MAG: hypothetical protein RLZZ54_766 [Cyanobacteriota bacterium]|jgi:hypothetical protein
MTALSCTSDSLVGSLCREAERIRNRCIQVSAILQSCQDAALSRRLNLECLYLRNRRQELLTTAERWRRRKQALDALMLDFLIELCRRD